MKDGTKSRRIALCMDLEDNFGHGIVRGVLQYAREHPAWQVYGYGWMFLPVRDISKWRGEGIIARVGKSEDEAMLSAKGVPVVDVAGAYTNNSFQQVNNDDRLTGRVAAQHFQERGFNHFAFVGASGKAWSEKRKQGFYEAIGPVPIACFEKTLPWWKKPMVFGGLGSFLKKLPKPCAVFACNDTAGVKITTACHTLNLAVPEMISVIGVDNEDVLCELSNPPLSSIPCYCEKIGYHAATILDKMIAGRKSAADILVPPKQPIVRQSSDTFNNPDPLISKVMNFIHANAHHGINVNNVVEHFGTSRRNLELRFRNNTDKTLHDVLIRARLEKAANLLAHTPLSIKQIAAKSGFHSLQRFYRVFDQYQKQTPLDYRKSHSADSLSH